MVNDVDSGYNFQNELIEIIQLFSLISKKLGNFNKEIESIPDLSKYYDMAKEDISHIMEGVNPNQEIYDLLNQKQYDLLKRRREIRDMEQVLTGNMSVTKLNDVLKTINGCISGYEGKKERFISRSYAMRTKFGSSTLTSILDSGAETVYKFKPYTNNKSQKSIATDAPSKSEKVEPVKKKGKYSIKKQGKTWHIMDAQNKDLYSNRSFEKMVRYVKSNSMPLENIKVPNPQSATFNALYNKLK